MNFNIDLDLVELNAIKCTLNRLIEEGSITGFNIDFTKSVIEKLNKQEKRILGGVENGK